MSADGRIERLGLKHRSLEQILEKEMSKPVTDTARVGELKKQKLLIKDQIQELQAAAA